MENEMTVTLKNGKTFKVKSTVILADFGPGLIPAYECSTINENGEVDSVCIYDTRNNIDDLDLSKKYSNIYEDCGDIDASDF